LADKEAAKRRRRENKGAREKAKAERAGPSPAQQAEAVRNVEADDPRHAERRTGLRRFGGRRHRRQPTVAVTRFASASTSRAATSSGRDRWFWSGMLRAERPDRLRAPLHPDRPG
jgi:hypothetical protein